MHSVPYVYECFVDGANAKSQSQSNPEGEPSRLPFGPLGPPLGSGIDCQCFFLWCGANLHVACLVGRYGYDMLVLCTKG